MSKSLHLNRRRRKQSQVPQKSEFPGLLTASRAYQCCRQWAWPSTRVPAGAGSESSPTPRGWPGAAWTENCLSFGYSAREGNSKPVRPGRNGDMQCQGDRALHCSVLLGWIFELEHILLVRIGFLKKLKYFKTTKTILANWNKKINWRLTGPPPKHADFNSVRVVGHTKINAIS